MDTAAFLTLGRWFTPAFPTGGFAWSHGLERLVADGALHDAQTLEDWLGYVLNHGAGRADAILLASAWRAEAGETRELAALARALAPGAERASETCEQGAAFARAVAEADGIELDAAPLPVVVGQAARAAGLPVEATLLFYLQGFASNLVTIAVRHIPLGQSEGQAVLARLAAPIAAIAAEAVHLGPEDIGSAAFATDLASLRHETQQPRMFRS